MRASTNPRAVDVDVFRQKDAFGGEEWKAMKIFTYLDHDDLCLKPIAVTAD